MFIYNQDAQDSLLPQEEGLEVLFHCLSDHMVPLDRPHSAGLLWSMLTPDDSPAFCLASSQFWFSASLRE